MERTNRHFEIRREERISETKCNRPNLKSIFGQHVLEFTYYFYFIVEKDLTVLNYQNDVFIDHALIELHIIHDKATRNK